MSAADVAGNGGAADPDDAAARREAGEAVRRLHHAVVGRACDPEQLRHLADTLHEAAAAFEVCAPRSRPVTTFSYETAPVLGVGETIDPGYGDRPFSGSSSPFGLGYDTVVDGYGSVRTTVQFDAAHEGAPGRSHGGFVVAFLDDLTGFVLPLARASAFTGEISVRFHAGVPLRTPLTGRAWLDRREGRKLFIDADLRAGDTVLATCKATYITVPGGYHPPG